MCTNVVMIQQLFPSSRVILCTGAAHADLLTKVTKEVMTVEQQESFWKYAYIIDKSYTLCIEK